MVLSNNALQLSIKFYSQLVPFASITSESMKELLEVGFAITATKSKNVEAKKLLDVIKNLFMQRVPTDRKAKSKKCLYSTSNIFYRVPNLNYVLSMIKQYYKDQN